MPRIVLIVIGLGLGLGLLYLIFVRELPRTEEQATVTAQQVLDLTGVVMREFRGNDADWVVMTDHAVVNEAKKQAELNPVRYQVLRSGGPDGRPVDIQGSADSAFMDESTGRVIMRGSSHVVKDRTLDLKSDELEYTRGSGVVVATGHVNVTQDNSLLQADSAEYTIGTDTLKMMAPRLYQ